MTIEMTREQTIGRMEEIHQRFEELAAKHRLSKSEDAEFAALRAEWNEIEEHVERLDRREAIAAAAGGSSGALRTERGSIGDSDESRPQRRDAAMRTIDGLVSSNRLPARAAEAVEAITRSGSRAEQSWTQRMVEAVGSDDYLRAFARLVADPERGHLMWDPQEQSAFQRVQSLRGERAMAESAGDTGAFMIPLTLDPSILITNAGNVNPLRQIARTVQIATNSWNGVTSAGVTAHWLPEAQEVTDDSPTLGQPHIPVHKAGAFIPWSFEVEQDAVNFATEMAKLLVDGMDQLTATAFTTGTGTDEPTGIVTALNAASGSVVNTATGDTLVSGDIYALQNALAPRFQAGARWAANLSILNTLRQFETSNGALKFPSLQTDPPTLLGRPAHELSNADGTIDAGQDNAIVIYGSFAEFVIVDRWPSSLELIPHIFGPNRRPTGQRGAFLYARTGSDVVVPSAFRMLVA